MTTGQAILWGISNVVSCAFGVVFGAGLALATLRKYATQAQQQQLEATRKVLELKKEFGLLGDEKR